MKIFYFIGSLLMTVLILIFSFENIQGICSYIQFLFFDVSNISPTFLFFGTAILGVITGMFYFGLLHSLLSGKGTDEDEDF
ncbi:hypothetical protein HYV57_05400 [Candidatus Peregrinibacteria bacterium]|nr:hypothetical protein [Candidatus Peregrinibacteria bacterium]